MNLKIISWNIRGLIDRDKIMERRLLWELAGLTSWWGTSVGGGAACWGMGRTSSVGGLLQGRVLVFVFFGMQWVMPWSCGMLAGLFLASCSSFWGLWKDYSGIELLFFSIFVCVGGSSRLVLYFLPCGVDCSLYFRGSLYYPIVYFQYTWAISIKFITYQKKYI